MSRGKRLEVIASLVPDGVFCIDVGADHGHVAQRVGAVATERRPHRAGRKDVSWVIADGLQPFRSVEFATICGMGARTIHRILREGPQPTLGAVVHAQDDPPLLRSLLCEAGWRIDAEALAPEAGRYAEVVRVVPGVEPTSGLERYFGPKLLKGDDPYLIPHLRQVCGYWASIAERTATSAPDVHAAASARVDFLQRQLALREIEGAAKR